MPNGDRDSASSPRPAPATNPSPSHSRGEGEGPAGEALRGNGAYARTADYYHSMGFIVTVRAAGDPALLRPAVRRAIQEVFPMSPNTFHFKRRACFLGKILSPGGTMARHRIMD